MTRKTTTEMLQELNGYRGDNIWQDVVEGLPLDRAATESADPTGASNIVILRDGTVLRHDARMREWTSSPEEWWPVVDA